MKIVVLGWKRVFTYLLTYLKINKRLCFNPYAVNWLQPDCVTSDYATPFSHFSFPSLYFLPFPVSSAWLLRGSKSLPTLKLAEVLFCSWRKEIQLR